MKTIGKQFQRAGNISLVQFETLEGEGLCFVPAASVIDKGELEIREVRQEGSVNTLVAINSSDQYCLLTDMDLLKGAKQNRVVNTPALLAPNSKREIRVSCVERSRWSYDSPDFKSAPSVMDSKMRAAKAASLSPDKENKEDMVSETQSKIWDLINQEMIAHNVFCSTEDYNTVLESKSSIRDSGIKFKYENSCNGLAVFDDRKLILFDIFGNRPVYAYYFEKLILDAVRRISKGEDENGMEQAEVFYILDEFLDEFESKLGNPIECRAGEIGEFSWSGHQDHPGFQFSFKNQLVHMAGFAV